jgi:hypothetical protein
VKSDRDRQASKNLKLPATKEANHQLSLFQTKLPIPKISIVASY